MAVGKNPRSMKGKKKKKYIDPFTRKDWFQIKAPAPFKNRRMGYTPANRTVGQKVVTDYLKGRIFEVSLADLQNDESQFFQKISLKCQEIQGDNVLTSFHGLSFTTDKSRSLVRKWQSLIESFLDVKTADGYILRLFCVGFTRRSQGQRRNTSYAQSSQIRAIRKKMFDIMRKEAESCDLKSLVEKFIANSIGEKIRKVTQGIYPLQNVFIRKVKVLKAPKFDAFKFSELHEAGDEAPVIGATGVDLGEDVGEAVERVEGEAAEWGKDQAE